MCLTDRVPAEANVVFFAENVGYFTSSRNDLRRSKWESAYCAKLSFGKGGP